jgi:hypothetical protein
MRIGPAVLLGSVLASCTGGRPMSDQHNVVIANEVRLVDAAGNTRLLLTTRSGTPSLQFLSGNGTVGMTADLDQEGRGAFRIQNPEAQGPVASIEVDAKGTHVKFDKPNGASCYLFLNNAGESGAVFIDAAGKRRVNVLVDPTGGSRIERLDDAGRPIP